MGVISTGAIFKTLTFDGKSSSEFNVYITGEGVFNAPERAVEMISIPGRNGAFALDNGRFENIEVTYNCGIAGDDDTDFAEAVSAFRNWLCSRNGYVRLSDDYNAGEYRMALYKSGLEVTAENLKAGEFPIVFECKPQRFLTSGEEKITVGEWGETTTETGDIVEIENPDGILSVKSLTADINAEQDLNGYSSPWAGGGGKNKCPNTFNGSYSGITYEALDNGKVHASGTVTAASWQNLAKSFSLSECGLNVGDTVTISSGIRAIAQFKDAGNTTLASCDSRGVKTTTIPEDTVSVYGILYAKNTVGVVGETIDEELWAQLEIGTAITSFEPFENICPITGWSDVNVNVSGVNVWDEVWELGSLDASTGANANSTLRMRSKNYIPVVGGTTYYFKCDTSVYNGWFIWCLYDANKNYLGYITPTNNGQTTLSQNVRYIRFVTNDTWGGQNYASGISINYPATDTAYHAYDGTTYTTSLGSTVYGGTLDVISGELTITHKYITLDGVTNNRKFTVAATSGAIKYFYLYLGSNEHGITSSSVEPRMISDQFTIYPSVAVGHAYITGSGSILVVVLPDQSITTVADANTWLANNLPNFVYELATPTTTTLTAQQVELLLGANNIWADTGDVAVEYGQNPNIIVNPTLFDSRPLLEVEGYGNIDIGTDEIEIHNEPVGNIIIYNKTSWDSANTRTITVETQYANVNDEITVNAGPTFSASYMGDWTLAAGTITSASATVTGNGSANAGGIPGTKQMFPTIRLGDTNFVYGTSATYTATASLSIVTSNYGTLTGSIGITLAYDGNSTFTLSRSATRPSQFSASSPQLTIGDITLASSQTLLGNPLYVDLDIGEAYKIENDVFASINNGVVLPAELPTLAPGNNTITFDNTITGLDIVPRWFKI